MRIAIIGAGPVGLTMAHLLRNKGIGFKIFERELNLRNLPSAHYLGIRSMEILEEIDNLQRPVQNLLESPNLFRSYRYCKRIGGSGNLFLETDHFGPNSETFFEDLEQMFSHSRFAHIPQHKLLEYLKNELDARNDSKNEVHFGHELSRINKTEAYSLVFEKKHGGLVEEEFDLILGCDGAHSRVRDLLGFSFDFQTNILDFVNVYFQSESVSNYILESNEQAMLHFVYNSEIVGCLVNHSFENAEFVLQIPVSSSEKEQIRNKLLNDKKSLQMELTEKIQNLFPPEFKQKLKKTRGGIDILNIGMWRMGSSLVNKMGRGQESGSAVLLGDAAHTMPPSGGLGLNTGIQDAFHLAHQISLLHKGYAQNVQACLEKYSNERKFAALRNINLAQKNYDTVTKLNAGLGLNMSAYRLLDSVSSKLPLGKPFFFICIN